MKTKGLIVQLPVDQLARLHDLRDALQKRLDQPIKLEELVCGAVIQMLDGILETPEDEEG